MGTAIDSRGVYENHNHRTRYSHHRRHPPQEQLERFLDGSVSQFVLDLSAVPFMDSAGLAALMNVHNCRKNAVIRSRVSKYMTEITVPLNTGWRQV